MQLREKRKSNHAIPTSAMGDVAFLILIFFLTATVFTKDKGLKMLLPEKAELEDIVQVKPENIVMIMINPVGAIRIKAAGEEKDLSPHEYGEIKRIVEERLLERDTLLVVSLRTSKEAPYKNMVNVLDQIKLCRVTAPDGRELRANKISLIPTSEE
ncbi:biopolymer transporter ExbD [candidate division WOR-3 bacterium]|nr:biopolymer transporter ExbD [candidate division WOR-3 bacterium]